MIFRIKMIDSAVVLTAILLFSLGCGTMMNGTQGYLGIMSKPAGARIFDRHGIHQVVYELAKQGY